MPDPNLELARKLYTESLRAMANEIEALLSFAKDFRPEISSERLTIAHTVLSAELVALSDVPEPEHSEDVYPDPEADTNGTSLQGYLDSITYTELVAKLGEPHQGVSGDDKVDAEWSFQTPAGVATIYNYKSGPAYNPGENILLADVDDWHIGGVSEAVVEYIREYVLSIGD